MRLPQFSADMLPVQQLALAVNAVLKRNGLEDQMITWRKFYYDYFYGPISDNFVSIVTRVPCGFTESNLNLPPR